MTIPVETISYNNIELEIPISLIHPSIIIDILSYDNLYKFILNNSISVLNEEERTFLLVFHFINSFFLCF